MSALLEELAEAPEVRPGTGIGPGTVIGGRFEVLRELGREASGSSSRHGTGSWAGWSP